ncbi:MAG: GGDEF domain-containing protein [Deltaproteobacteria bacterium]|nr:GGDEF domain-containing protein [Deltaproteobacteria bacterium]
MNSDAAPLLHVETLLIVYLMVAVLMLGVIVGGAWQARGRHGLWFWSGAFAAVALSQVLRHLIVWFDGPAPLYTIGHVGGVVSDALVLLGVRAFLGLRLRWLPVLVFTVLAALVSAATVAFGMRLWISLSCSLLAGGLLCLLALLPVARAWRSEGGFPLSLMVTDLGLSVPVNWLRAVMVIPGISGSYAQATQANALWLMVFIALLLLQGFALLLLINSRLQQKILSLVEVDPLTGLLNRRGLENRIARLLHRAEGSPHGLTMAAAMVDIDHFKNANDRHGHAVGDEVLCDLGRRLQLQVRPNDLAVRLGGEEFAVVWFDVNAEMVRGMAERLRQAVEGEPFQTEAGDLRVSVSVGVAAQGLPRESLDSLLRRADVALYEAKRAGRNRVVQAP